MLAIGPSHFAEFCGDPSEIRQNHSCNIGYCQQADLPDNQWLKFLGNIMQPMEVYGLALMDYFLGDHHAKLMIRRDDGHEDTVPINIFFRLPTDLQIDKLALDKCSGRVLDVGAGTGEHALYLQDHGFKVTAIDVSSHACEIMRKRGVKKVIHADITQWNPLEKFDTVLLLGRSIGLVGTLSGFGQFLAEARSLIGSSGQLLFNSLDVQCSEELRDVQYRESNRLSRKYIGEIRMQFEYKRIQSEFFHHIHVDPETVIDQAKKKGWLCEILAREQGGNFLARLVSGEKP